MEIKVGIKQVAREVVLESNKTAAEIAADVSEALESESVLTLVDAHGRKVLIPGPSIGYVEIGEETARRVGFGSG